MKERLGEGDTELASDGHIFSQKSSWVEGLDRCDGPTKRKPKSLLPTPTWNGSMELRTRRMQGAPSGQPTAVPQSSTATIHRIFSCLSATLAAYLRPVIARASTSTIEVENDA